MSDVTILPSVTVIGPYSFYACISLQQITIPSSDKSIESFAFFSCSSLEEIEFTSSLEKIGEIAIEFFGPMHVFD